jgi:membrane fusion protein, heavy metal efflux system
MNNKKCINWQALLLITLTSLVLMGCGKSNKTHNESGEHGTAAPLVEKGSHNGRLLKDKSFTLELAIFETGVPPEFRAWAFDDGKPVTPKELDLKIKLTRFGNKVDAINFSPEGDFLRSTTTIFEPHSFIVNITATYKGKSHQWSYESLEGRTKIEAKVAEGLEIKNEIAGPATLEETIDVYGNVIADPALERFVSARFDGLITAVHVGRACAHRRCCEHAKC